MHTCRMYILKWNKNGVFKIQSNSWGISISLSSVPQNLAMGLLSDTQNCRLRMRRECRESFSPPPISKETAS